METEAFFYSLPMNSPVFSHICPKMLDLPAEVCYNTDIGDFAGSPVAYPKWKG